MEKERYVAGEPIFLFFDLTNNGAEPFQAMFGAGSRDCRGYAIEVLNHGTGAHQCKLPRQLSCISPGFDIAPGQTLRERILLQVDYDLSQPGTYDITAIRSLDFAKPAADSFVTEKQPFKVETNLTIQLTPAEQPYLVSVLQPYIADLDSMDDEVRHEAARVITSLAPPFLERTILAMDGSRVGRFEVLRGLGRLNTPRSREALARIAQDNTQNSYMRLQAIERLAETGDRSFLPLLLQAAQEFPSNQARDFVVAFARLGGEDALPFLETLLSSTDAFSRGNAVMALPEMRSRRAVPILIEMLKENDGMGKLASIGLVHMTRRNPLKTGRAYSETPSAEYPLWHRWWARNGATAPIYSPSYCRGIKPLPLE